MHFNRVLGFTLLSILSTNCAGVFSARGNVTGAGASAQVSADPRLATAAGILASGAEAVAAGGGAASRTDVTATVHTGAGTSGGLSSGSDIEEAGGSSSVSVASASSSVGSGAVTTAGAGGGGSTSGGASMAASTSANVTVSLGRVTGVTVERVVAGDRGDLIGGGELTLVGAPVTTGLAVLDGRVTTSARVDLGAGSVRRASSTSVNTLARRGARWTVSGGTVLLGDGQGRRWRARVVSGGTLEMHTEGTNPQGNTVWSPGAGELRVEIIASGDQRLVLDGVLPGNLPGTGIAVASRGASGRGAAGEQRVEAAAGGVIEAGIPARAQRALDALIHAAPRGSRESLRLAAAVDMVLRGSVSDEPSEQTVPVRGRSVVLLVDVSYSMNDVDPRASDLALGRDARPTKLDVARAELVKILGSLPEGVTANVIAFSSASNQLWTQTRVVDDAGLEAAVRWIAGLRVADETHPLEALEAAAAMRPEQIVLLSDGRPSHREEVTQAVLGLASGLSSRIRIDVVGVGPDQDRTFLAALADRGHGVLRSR